MSDDTVELQGDTLHLKDSPVDEGGDFPDFQVVEDVPEPVDFDDDEKQNSVHIITTAVSVDTPVCANQFTNFDKRAADLKDEGIETWYVSRDLPFALQRYAEENDLNNVRFLSDYKFRDFGETTALAVEETELLTRATFVVDRDGKVVYRELQSNIADEPDYEAAVEAARKAAKQ